MMKNREQMRQALRALLKARGLLSNSSGNTFAVLKALLAAKAPACAPRCERQTKEE